MDRQPPQAEASPSERSDLLRQLVPVISPAAENGRGGSRTALDLANTVHDPHPNRPQLPDVHTLDDVNEDLFA